jgi:hypothetical protein
MRHRIRVVYFDYARYEWLAMGDGEEVYAWRELPAVPELIESISKGEQK